MHLIPLLLAVLPLCGLGSPEGPPAGAGGPRIAVEPAQLQFGRLLQGKSVSRRLLIRNLGDRELLIERVDSSCDCAVALAAGTRIPPGDSAPVRVTLRTGSASGRVVRRLSVKSNDPTHATTDVLLEAIVVAAKPAGEVR